ncbi:MAG: hypothetical protein K2Y18_05205 [Alphaproteobacteria bacterium]|nr:hypothetical protein [Alphaproteobacteria bacterium]
MKFLRTTLCLLLCICAAQASEVPLPKISIPLWTLLLDVEDSHKLPRRFRSTRGTLPMAIEENGLADLRMSGSAQFAALQFKSILEFLGKYGVSPNQVVVVDLREEPHAFINGDAVLWYARGAWWTQGDPVVVVLENEKENLAKLTMGQRIDLKKIANKDAAGYVRSLTDHSFVITSMMTEKDVVTGNGAHYVRLPVTDHMRPEDKDVEQFLELVKNLPPKAWVHFHCHAGQGRTSTFMVMYDMLRNLKLSRDAIIDRQVKLGSLDIRRLSGPLKARKHPVERMRLEFIHLFYDYLHAQDGYRNNSWTTWVTQRYAKSGNKNDKNNAFASTRVASKERDKSS